MEKKIDMFLISQKMIDNSIISQVTYKVPLPPEKREQLHKDILASVTLLEGQDIGIVIKDPEVIITIWDKELKEKLKKDQPWRS